mmetsp:Transcript_20893/g.50576  ORF Transcript_20893/g.50576 Transcript_20893/m.50576 type:complete len:240 (-) Transcript_20893:704-1423(-)
MRAHPASRPQPWPRHHPRNLQASQLRPFVFSPGDCGSVVIELSINLIASLILRGIAQLPHKIRSRPAHTPYGCPAAVPHPTQRERDVGPAAVGPPLVPPVLLLVPDLFLMLGVELVVLPQFFDEPEKLQGDLVVLIGEPSQQVGEDVGLVVHLVRQRNQPVDEGFVPEPPHCRVPVEIQRREIVHPGNSLVKRLDRYAVGVLPSDHMLDHLMAVLPLPGQENRRHGPEPGDTELGVLVH